MYGVFHLDFPLRVLKVRRDLFQPGSQAQNGICQISNT